MEAYFSNIQAHVCHHLLCLPARESEYGGVPASRPDPSVPVQSHLKKNKMALDISILCYIVPFPSLTHGLLDSPFPFSQEHVTVLFKCKVSFTSCWGGCFQFPLLYCIELL